MKHRLSIQHIAAASEAIDPVFRDTPQFEAETLSKQLGFRVVVKVETLNPIRSFKARGAQFLVSQMSGFAASGLRYGGQLRAGHGVRGAQTRLDDHDLRRRNANPMKVDRMRQMGATVRAGQRRSG